MYLMNYLKPRGLLRFTLTTLPNGLSPILLLSSAKPGALRGDMHRRMASVQSEKAGLDCTALQRAPTHLLLLLCLSQGSSFQ
jgi:hypothetical protein